MKVWNFSFRTFPIKSLFSDSKTADPITYQQTRGAVAESTPETQTRSPSGWKSGAGLQESPSDDNKTQTMGLCNSTPGKSTLRRRNPDSGSPALETPRREISIKTLRQKYNNVEGRESFQEKYVDVIAYVQALEKEKSETTNQLDGLNGIFVDISATVEQWKPGSKSVRRVITDARQTPDYIRHIHQSFEEQYNHAGRLVARIEELDGKIRNHQEDIRGKGQEIAKLKQKNLNDAAAYQDKIVRDTAAHDAKVAQIEGDHSRQIREIQETHRQELARKQRHFDDTSRRTREEHNVEKTRLQNALLTTIDGFKPLTDKACKIQLEDLRNSVHNLAFLELDDIETINHGPLWNRVAAIQNPQSKDFKNALEGCFWDVIFRELFATPFSVFGEYGESYMLTWTNLFQTVENLHDGKPQNWPPPDSRSESWRYVTFETLQKGLTNESKITRLEESYNQKRNFVASGLTQLYAEVAAKEKHREIIDIVDRACQLALDLGKQRCRFQMIAPQTNDWIDIADPEICRALNHTRDTVIPEIQLLVKPGLRKTGDSRGGSFGSVTNMFPAAVYLKASP